MVVDETAQSRSVDLTLFAVKRFRRKHANSHADRDYVPCLIFPEPTGVANAASY